MTRFMQVEERRRGRNEEAHNDIQSLYSVAKLATGQEAHESIIYLSDSFVMKLSVAYKP